MANQYEADPRQLDFLARYLNPNSKTYSNIYQSAIAAKYSKEYAENMRLKERDWVSENVGKVTKGKLVEKAKNNLDQLLDSENENIKADITKFVAKTDVEFSEKREDKIILPTPLLGASSVQTDDSDQEVTEA